MGFRVIVAGGGLVGLTTAHILSKAGIDFVVLEQYDNVTPYLGSLLSIVPGTLRVLDQLGLLGPLRPLSDDVENLHFFAADTASTVREESGLFTLMKEEYSTRNLPMLLLDRLS